MIFARGPNKALLYPSAREKSMIFARGPNKALLYPSARNEKHGFASMIFAKCPNKATSSGEPQIEV